MELASYKTISYSVIRYIGDIPCSLPLALKNNPRNYLGCGQSKVVKDSMIGSKIKHHSKLNFRLFECEDFVITNTSFVIGMCAVSVLRKSVCLGNKWHISTSIMAKYQKTFFFFKTANLDHTGKEIKFRAAKA